LRYRRAPAGVYSLMGKVLAALAAVLAIASGCARPGAGSGCTAAIDWVDFVKVGSTMYVAGPQPDVNLQETDLGAVHSHVKFKVDGNVCDPSYRPKDGDAAFLDPGTAIYEVTGQPPAQLLAAHQNGRVVAFRAQPRSP